MGKPRRRSLVSCRTTSELGSARASLHRKVLCPEYVGLFLMSLLLVCQVQMSQWLLEEKSHVTMQEQLRIVSECRERLEVEAAGFRLDLTRECIRVADL